MLKKRMSIYSKKIYININRLKINKDKYRYILKN